MDETAIDRYRRALELWLLREKKGTPQARQIEAARAAAAKPRNVAEEVLAQYDAWDAEFDRLHGDGGSAI